MSKQIEKLVTILAFSLPLSIFIFAICLLFLVKRVPGAFQFESSELVPIYDQQSLTQTITLEQSGLDTVMVFLKNSRLENKDKFIFRIEDREIVINGYNIGDGDTVKFQFTPLELPAGKTISFTLSAPDTKNPNQAIKAGISASDIYKQGELSGRFSPRDLSFQLFYQPKSKKELLINSVKDFIARL